MASSFAFVRLAFFRAVSVVISIMITSSRYHERKPLPIVIRKMFSGSGRRPCPSCVMNGYVANDIRIVMMAPFHHFLMLLSREASGVRRLLSALKNGISRSRFRSGSIENIPQSIAAKTSTSLIMNVWSVLLRSVFRSRA